MEKYLMLEKNNIVSVMLTWFLNFSGDMTRQYKQMQEELIEEIDYYKEKSVEKDQILGYFIFLSFNRRKNSRFWYFNSRIRLQSQEERWWNKWT